MFWALQGSDDQREIAGSALERCTFPFGSIGGDDRAIPVEWQDLSRYASTTAEKSLERGHEHIHENGDIGHPIEARNQVLGLAWYSGRVTLDRSLILDPELAGEVLLSEGAHMLDFFWFEDAQRIAVWNALHPDAEDLPLDSPVEDGVILGGSEGWFDVGPYRSWVGEAWMGLFTRAYSDFDVTIPFDRPPTDEAVSHLRKSLTPYFTTTSGVVHDQHRGLTPVQHLLEIPTDARRCKICKPI